MSNICSSSHSSPPSQSLSCGVLILEHTDLFLDTKSFQHRNCVLEENPLQLGKKCPPDKKMHSCMPYYVRFLPHLIWGAVPKKLSNMIPLTVHFCGISALLRKALATKSVEESWKRRPDTYYKCVVFSTEKNLCVGWNTKLYMQVQRIIVSKLDCVREGRIKLYWGTCCFVLFEHWKKRWDSF